MKEYMTAAIQSLRPGSEFSYSNDDYSTIQFDVIEGEPPTIDEVKTEMVRLEKLADEQVKKDATAKAALLARLGITADEAALLLK
jgi:hypothetical protein